jgi:hypothetical protein
MVTLFICNEVDCPNAGILYRMEDANPTAICGGCKATLNGTIEEQNG